MMARPTIKSIAKRTGLSVGTVSNALRGSESVKAKTRQKVQAAADELGYRVNLDGLKLKTRKSFQIAVLVNMSANQPEEWEGVEFTRILAGISAALDGSPYRLNVVTVRDMADALRALQQMIMDNAADGVILSGTCLSDPRIAFLQDNNIPFVTYGMSDSKRPHAYVDFDSQTAAFDATKRLIDLGHQRIALVNPPQELIYARQRVQGLTQALQQAGLPADPALVFSGPTTAKTGSDAFAKMWSLPNRPSACICANEAMTLGVLSAAAQAGACVGQDFVVISTDDLQLSRYFVPPPSAYYVPIEETSKLLGEFILKRLEGADLAETQKKIRATFIERQPDTIPPTLAGAT